MDHRRFSALISPHLGSVQRLARRLAPVDADDLAQAALLRAWEKRGDLREPEKVRGWLMAVTRTVHLNRVRGVRPTLVLLEGGANEPAGDLEAELQARGLDDELTHALASLPEEQATALWLREVEELSYEELAEAMQCPVGTIRSRLARARAAMLAALSSTRQRGERR